VHSESVCTWREDKGKIVNNGDEPWKRIFFNMGPAFDDDDDDDDVVVVVVLYAACVAVNKRSIRCGFMRLRTANVFFAPWTRALIVCSQFTCVAVYGTSNTADERMRNEAVIVLFLRVVTRNVRSNAGCCLY